MHPLKWLVEFLLSDVMLCVNQSPWQFVSLNKLIKEIDYAHIGTETWSVNETGQYYPGSKFLQMAYCPGTKFPF